MCEIQFVMSDTLGNDNVNNFIDMLSKGSKSNDDATGIFSSSYQWKIGKAYEDLKDKKDDSIRHVLSALPSNWLVGHNRLATQGSENDNENNHPFSNDTCTIVHNGIISNDDTLKTQYGFDYKAETDSAIVPALIDHYIRDGKDEIDAIKESAEELRGSYSIFVFMHSTQNLYYLKNNSTSFYMMKTLDANDNVSIYGSTSKSSLEDMSYIKSDGLFGSDLFKARHITSPEGGVIYHVVYKGDNGMDVLKAGEFAPQSYVYKGGTTYYGGGAYSYGGNAYATYDWDSLDDTDYVGDSCSLSKNETKRKERAESSEAMNEILKEFDTNVDDVFEGVVTDIENFCVYDEDIIFSGQFTNDIMDAVSTYSSRHQQIVLRDVPTMYGTYLENYLDATAWISTDDVGKGEDISNYTVKYQAIVKYIEDNQ